MKILDELIVEGLGRNLIDILAADTKGGQLPASVVLWAGANTMAVTVVDESGAPISNANLLARLSDDRRVTQVGIPDLGNPGTSVLSNVPGRTIMIEAFSP